MSFRYAICNETFADWEFPRICEVSARCGYHGLEIAPYPLSHLVTDLSAERRLEIKKTADSFGLQIIGLHWLLAYTEGMEITSPDADTRKRTGAYLGELAKCCREWGGDVLVLGSPQRRRIPAGFTREQAADFAIETIGRATKALEEHDVDLALEPLSIEETDFLNSCEETAALIQRISHPHVQLHLDVKAMASERTSIANLIQQYGGMAVHFHANDANRRGPGFGDTDFRPIFESLRQSGYCRWISVEVFDTKPSSEIVARESIRYLRACESDPG